VIVTATEGSVLYFDRLFTRITRGPTEPLWSLCGFEDLFFFRAKLGITPCDNFFLELKVWHGVVHERLELWIVGGQVEQ